MSRYPSFPTLHWKEACSGFLFSTSHQKRRLSKSVLLLGFRASTEIKASCKWDSDFGPKMKPTNGTLLFQISLSDVSPKRSPQPPTNHQPTPNRHPNHSTNKTLDLPSFDRPTHGFFFFLPSNFLFLFPSLQKIGDPKMQIWSSSFILWIPLRRKGTLPDCRKKKRTSRWEKKKTNKKRRNCWPLPFSPLPVWLPTLLSLHPPFWPPSPFRPSAFEASTLEGTPFKSSDSRPSGLHLRAPTLGLSRPGPARPWPRSAWAKLGRAQDGEDSGPRKDQQRWHQHRKFCLHQQ